jgi:tRNA-splicing ligase RtcB
MGLRAKLEKIDECIWELPACSAEGMLVPGRIHATRTLLDDMDDGVFEQVANVASLRGVTRAVCCMPDGHWGYGFPIGGMAAMDAEQGVICPGGIGFDINCGMRLVRTDLTERDVKPRLEELIRQLFERIPSGVGCKGLLAPSKADFKHLVEQGSRWCIDHGYGWEDDLASTEDGGCMTGADADAVSERAIERGFRQVGTLGSGNHYLEVQVLRKENVFDAATAAEFGLNGDNQVVVMFHCGSRGFGHQIASDYLSSFLERMTARYGLQVNDRQLACAPFASRDGQAYFAAMACAVNMAFANRQVILHRIRNVFSEVFQQSPEQLGMHQVYDISHNTAKLEEHEVDGHRRRLLVHRKGATRAFPPGHAELPPRFRKTGQPVIIGGSMETGSYLLTGVESGASTFYTTAHGSGRTMSRNQARKQFDGRQLLQAMRQRGILVRTASLKGLAEEAGGAYKDIDEVIEAARKSGISRPVARFLPLANVKG